MLLPIEILLLGKEEYPPEGRGKWLIFFICLSIPRQTLPRLRILRRTGRSGRPWQVIPSHKIVSVFTFHSLLSLFLPMLPQLPQLSILFVLRYLQSALCVPPYAPFFSLLTFHLSLYIINYSIIPFFHHSPVK